MRSLLPRTLTGQMLGVLLLSLVASHVVGITIYSLDRGRTITYTEAHDFADRVVGVVNMVGRLPAEWRDEIVRLSDGRTLHAMLGSDPDMVEQDIDEDVSSEVRRYLLNQFPGRPSDSVVVGVSDTPFFSREKVLFNQAIEEPETALDVRSEQQSYEYLHVSVRLEEGEWLNLVGAIRKGELLRLAPSAGYVLSIVAGIAIFAVWLIKRVTVPFVDFAQAADRLGKDISTEPLAVSGPREIAGAAQAFNSMQQRLRHMIQNRSHMLAAVSHDLRTPVTLMRLRTESLGNRAERTNLLRILDEMEAMIASILEFSRATALDEPRRLVDLSALVESICDDLADTGADVAFSNPAGKKIVYRCHRTGIKRAITNLITNAVKYGGNARVRLECDSDAIHIVIDDDGPGIPPEQQEHVFTPFFRIEPSRNQGAGGVGLGLSIAQVIVNGHGGRIDLENRRGGGLRVTISLPE